MSVCGVRCEIARDTDYAYRMNAKVSRNERAKTHAESSSAMTLQRKHLLPNENGRTKKQQQQMFIIAFIYDQRRN